MLMFVMRQFITFRKVGIPFWKGTFRPSISLTSNVVGWVTGSANAHDDRKTARARYEKDLFSMIVFL